MAPILSPRETSFLFPLLEESSFSWVISKELWLKASHPGAAVWTCSGFTSSTEVVSHKFISWDLWVIGVEILLTMYSEGDLWIYFSYKLKRLTIWAGCSRDKRDLTLSRTVTSTVNSGATPLCEGVIPCNHPALKVQRHPKASLAFQVAETFALEVLLSDMKCQCVRLLSLSLSEYKGYGFWALVQSLF